MRGVGGPLLTVSDLLSDLAVEGGDDHLDGGGDASVPSSPLAAHQVEEADPSELQRLFASYSVVLDVKNLAVHSPIDSYRVTSPTLTS
ncbi:hypothetical protein D1007_38041 [Hordeum vulgare]|nr:hypothetical protein D1007_38041 [Hordeum vulgare]